MTTETQLEEEELGVLLWREGGCSNHKKAAGSESQDFVHSSLRELSHFSRALIFVVVSWQAWQVRWDRKTPKREKDNIHRIQDASSWLVNRQW